MHHNYEYVIKIAAALYVGVEYISIFGNVALVSPSVGLCPFRRRFTPKRPQYIEYCSHHIAKSKQHHRPSATELASWGPRRLF